MKDQILEHLISSSTCSLNQEEDAKEIFKIVETLRLASLPRVSTQFDINTSKLVDVFTDTTVIEGTKALIDIGVGAVGEMLLKGKIDAENLWCYRKNLFYRCVYK